MYWTILMTHWNSFRSWIKYSYARVQKSCGICQIGIYNLSLAKQILMCYPCTYVAEKCFGMFVKMNCTLHHETSNTLLWWHMPCVISVDSSVVLVFFTCPWTAAVNCNMDSVTSCIWYTRHSLSPVDIDSV